MAIFRYNEDTINNYYAYLIEGHGDDANDGLTPETAVATMNRLVQVLDGYTGALRRYAVVLKYRIFNETITHVRSASKPITFEFIQKTIIDGSGGVFYNTRVSNDVYINCLVINYLEGRYFAGTTGAPSVTLTIINGMVLNCKSFHHQYIGPANLFFVNSVAANCSTFVRVNSTQTCNLDLVGSVLYKTTTTPGTLSSATSKINAKNTVFVFCNDLLFPIVNIDYCNIYGLLGGKTNEEWQALGQNLSGIQLLPQFNSEIDRVFTVRSSSPCLYRGENGEHIGIGEGFWLSANEIFNNLELNDNFQVQAGKFLRVDDSSDALLETYILNLGGVKSVEKIDVAANLGFLVNELKKSLVIYSDGYIAYDSGSKYHTGASVTDSGIKYRSLVDDNVGNTPATSPTDWERMTWESGVSYAAGKIVQYTDDKWYKANTATSTSWVGGEWDEIVIADYLTFQMKFGRTFSEANAADWTNLPFNILLQVDASGKGSVDDDFDASTAASIRFNYYKLRIHAKTIR